MNWKPVVCCLLLAGCSPNNKILTIAEKEMGVGYEIGREDPPPRVVQYIRDTGQDPQELTGGWCSGFVCWVLKKAGCEYPRGNTDREWQFVLEQTKDPQPGDVAVVLEHVAFVYKIFYDASGRKMLEFLGGAQAGRVCILAEPYNHILWFGKPIKAPRHWVPAPTIEQLREEDFLLTVKRPEPQFVYPCIKD